MKRVYNYSIALVFLMLMWSEISAQKKYEISVKQAVNIAFENVVELKNLRADSLLQWSKNKEIEGMAYPQISGTSSLSHYLSLPLIQFPDASESSIYSVLNSNGVKDGSGNTIQKKDAFAVRNFSFAQPWNAQFGLAVNQLLFQPDVFVGLKARTTAMNFAKENIKVSEDKVKEQVYKAYFQIIIAEKQLQFLNKTIERLKKLDHDMNVMYANGFAEKLDINKVAVTYNNTQSTRTQVENHITYLKLAETLSSFQSRLRENAKTLDILERQKIVRLLVREVAVSNDKIIIRHSIPTHQLAGSHEDSPSHSHSRSERGAANKNYLLRSGGL